MALFISLRRTVSDYESREAQMQRVRDEIMANDKARMAISDEGYALRVKIDGLVHDFIEKHRIDGAVEQDEIDAALVTLVRAATGPAYCKHFRLADELSNLEEDAP